jgi:hypothetical protein
VGHTENRAIEDELVPAALVCLEDLDVNNTEDKIEHQEDRSNRNIGYDFWVTAEALISRSIRRTL